MIVVMTVTIKYRCIFLDRGTFVGCVLARNGDQVNDGCNSNVDDVDDDDDDDCLAPDRPFTTYVVNRFLRKKGVGESRRVRRQIWCDRIASLIMSTANSNHNTRRGTFTTPVVS